MVRMGRWIAAILAIPLSAQSLADFEKRVTGFTLDNGLQFVVMERRDAPVVSFHTYVKSGSAQDPDGKTGIAHMFEHMAFKGTPAIGTKDWTREKTALDAVNEAWDALNAERAKPSPSASQIVVIEGRLKSAVTRAQIHVEPDEFTRLIEENGGTGLNAATGVEATEFSCSLPSNRIELWFLLESERFLRPVFREFFKERDLVRQEREQRIGSNPQGRLVEALQQAAFTAHPYRNSPGGSAEDIERLGIHDAEAFFRLHYTPANIVIGIVGDVKAAEVKRLAAKYFARLPKGSPPPPVAVPEPEQKEARRVPVQSESQPLLYLAFKRPDQFHKDDVVLDVIGTILAGGRTARLYRSLVNQRRIAFTVGGAPTHPAGGAPCLFVLFAAPAPGHGVEESEQAIYEELERLKTEPVSAAELARVKIKARANVIQRLAGNTGLAQILTLFQGTYGDWKALFSVLHALDAVTVEDVQRTAGEVFVRERSTAVFHVRPGAIQ